MYWYDCYFDFINGESLYLGPEGREEEEAGTQTPTPSQARSSASGTSTIVGSSSVSSSRRKSAKRVPPAIPLPTSCARGCREFTKAGSNAYSIREACYVCGHSRTTASDTRVYEHTDCLHEEVDHRGSTKDMKRTFCKLCMTYIDEVPQEQARQADSVARSVRERASATQINIIDNLLDRNVIVSQTQATASIRLFAQMMTRMFQDARIVTLTDVVATLEDAVFNAVDTPSSTHASTSTATAKSKATAKPKASSSSQVDSSPTPTRTLRTHHSANMALIDDPSRAGTVMSKLRTVDIYTSPGIWAILDEGCNATCHG
jgi:hypothetical protein